MKKFSQFTTEALDDVSSFSHRRLSTILRDPQHPHHAAAKAEMDRRGQKNEGAMKRMITTQSNKADRMASTDKKGLETYKKKVDEISLDDLKTKISSSGLKSTKKAMGADKIKKDLEAMKAKLATEEKQIDEAAYLKGSIESRADAHEDQADHHNAQAEKAHKAGDKMAASTHKAAARAHMKAASYLDKHLSKPKHLRPQAAGGATSQAAHAATQKANQYNESVEQIDEARGTSAKYANQSGIMGGKYTSKDHMMGMKNWEKARNQRQKNKHDAHMKQDPSMAKRHKAGHIVDIDKAKKKAAKRGVDASHLNWRHANSIKQESTQIDEILDTPQAMQSYRDKNKRSKEKAANSAAAKIFRGPDKDGKRADHSPELNTMRKRRSGEKMSDRLAGRHTLKRLQSEEKDTHVTKDGRTVKKGLWYYMNKRKKAGTSRPKSAGTVDPEAMKKSQK